MKVSNLEEAKKIIKKEKPILARDFGVSKIGFFGSFVFNDFTPKSDVDILVDLAKESNLSLLDLIHIENHLSHKLGRKVDLITKNGLKPYIKNVVLNSVVYV
ncbi:MAG: nucleotidyltransferase family protein [Patescibacteria group bacterium]